MYETYWRLSRKPFDCGTDPGAYYPAESHQAALLKLRYVIESRLGVAVLVGEPGTGKTLLVRHLAARLPETCRPIVHLVFPQMPTADLLAYIAADLGTGLEPSGSTHSVEAHVRRIEQRLLEVAADGRHTVIAVDEAHLVDEKRTLEALRLLLNFEHEGRPAATLLLVGQTGLLGAVQRAVALEERVAARCLLQSLSLEETHGYVHHRLSLAGAQQEIFTEDAIERLHQLSDGVPQRINRLSDLALLIGFAEEQPSIDAEHIEAVCQELVVAPR